jgi:hypothetical protein
LTGWAPGLCPGAFYIQQQEELTMVFDRYGDADSPVLVLLHGAAALDTFANQYDTNPK